MQAQQSGLSNGGQGGCSTSCLRHWSSGSFLGLGLDSALGATTRQLSARECLNNSLCSALCSAELYPGGSTSFLGYISLGRILSFNGQCYPRVERPSSSVRKEIPAASTYFHLLACHTLGVPLLPHQPPNQLTSGAVAPSLRLRAQS